MATLRRRPNGIYFIDYRVGGVRRRMSTGTDNLKLARIKLKEIEIQLFRGDLDQEQKNENVVLVPFFRRFLNHIADNYVRAKMEQARLLTWQEYFARSKVKRLDQIHPCHVQDFFSTVLADHSEKTKTNYLGLLKRCLNCAVEWQVLDINPIANVKMPKRVKKFHYYSRKEVAKLIAKANEPLKTAIILLVNTGLRRSELWNLRWCDVNLRSKRLTVIPHGEYKTKSRSLRTVPLNASAYEALRRLKSNSREEYVYRLRAMGTYTDRFRELVRKLKMKGSLHSLRHTFASHLAMAGTPIPVIKELLGHSDISTTMIYAHLSPDIHKAEIEKLNF